MEAPDELTPDLARARWEAAYRRFETPEQEIGKFLRRYRAFGVDRWDRQLAILELFCGRGNGLVALERLGFRRVHGLDLSSELLALHRGAARRTRGDARSLPFRDASYDVVVVQGGLHHLTSMDDLEAVLGEVRRVLTPAGRFVIVEPWLTPFLRGVHAACRLAPLRRLSGRVDALATMIELERTTYDHWLGSPDAILRAIESTFAIAFRRVASGKLMLIGCPAHRS
jgi:SAM-dependent methyltransferase